MKNIAILGSTGSIGTQTLDVVSQHSKDLKVAALAAGSNIVLLEQQIRQYHPVMAAVWDEKKAEELKIAVSDLGCEDCFRHGRHDRSCDTVRKQILW